MPKQNPLYLFVRALVLMISGRFRVAHDVDGVIINEEKEPFHAFRKIIVEGKTSQTSPLAIFKVRFRFKNLSPRANRRLSLIPVPFIAAQPGFRSKTWLIGEHSGDFMGYYEFDTVADAEAYWDSLPLGMMRQRAQTGSLSYEICNKKLGTKTGDKSIRRIFLRPG